MKKWVIVVIIMQRYNIILNGDKCVGQNQHPSQLVAWDVLHLHHPTYIFTILSVMLA